MSLLKRWCLSFFAYWKTVGNDYGTVVMDIMENANEKPLSTIGKMLLIVPVIYAYKTNPTEKDMLNSLVERRHQMALIPNSIHNERADDEISSRTIYLGQNRLKHINCIFFSVLIKLSDSEEVCLYENRDSNLKRWWWQRYDDVIDIGAFGNWFRFRRNFKNHDINEKEVFNRI